MNRIFVGTVLYLLAILSGVMNPAIVLADGWPLGHPPFATVLQNSSHGNVYIWREGGHVWVEYEPSYTNPLVVSWGFTIIQDGVQLTDTACLIRSDGQSFSGSLFVRTVFRMATFKTNWPDYPVDSGPFTVYYLPSYEPTEVPAESAGIPPTEPALLTVVKNGSTAHLSWTAVAGAYGYVLAFGNYPDLTYACRIDMGRQTSTTWNIWFGSAEFYLAIIPYNEAGDGVLSNIQVFRP